jgi:hemerythrin superfamily protein
MKTSSTSTTDKSTPAGVSSKAKDAVQLLIDDHDHVRSLFEQYESLSDRSVATKKKLATQICNELTRHSLAEEEIFYPAVRAANKNNEDLIDEAIVEHASARDLIAQILDMEPSDDLYDAKVKVLQEMIEHHVREEEDEMFPKALEAKLDMDALGQEIADRKSEISV